MDQERWQRLKGVLDEVLEHEGSERETLVDRFCAEHPELAQDLRSLLLVAGDPTASRLANVGRAVPLAPPELPERIGPYRILSKLGEGGMGVVYEAEQTHPKRRVAVKVVRGGQFVDEQRARMFQREADTLALLKHPSIGAIYESGRTEDGQHYFAMELVRGETLDVYLRERPAVTREAEIRFRLALFRKIADAVHYAHQRGVIHRDLKPSNIIVTEETSSAEDDTLSGASSASHLPGIKILDFGLARITEGDVAAATMVTEIGVIKGTLPYMSPEQARGNPAEIDLRADVYALGVILFEMLSATRPYDLVQATLVEAVRVICEQAPRPLRQSTPGLKRLDPDVETIVQRALEKEADRRYASAAAFAEDVGRYLTAQPILARPPSAFYQLRKFAKRNKTLVGGVVATFVVLVAGIVVSTVFGLREARQRREVETTRNDLETVVTFQSGMLRGIEPSRMGLALIDDLERRVAAAAESEGLDRSRIDEELAQLRRSLGRINSTSAALGVLDRDVLERAARTIVEEFADRPLIAARLHASLAETYFELGLMEQAEEQFKHAEELLHSELGVDHRDTLVMRFRLANVYDRLGRLGEAESWARETYEAARRVYGEDAPMTLVMLNRLAISYHAQGRLDEAMQAYQVVHGGLREQLGEDHLETIWALHNVGSVLQLQGRPAEGLPMLEEALDRFRRVSGEDDYATLWAMESIGRAYLALGRLEDAERITLKTLDKRRHLRGDDHDRTLNSAGALAWIYKNQHRLEEAEGLFRDTLERQRRVLGSTHQETLWTIHGLAETSSWQGKPEEAARLFVELLETWERQGGPTHPQTINSMLWLGAAYRRMGRFEESEALVERATELRPPDDPEIGWTLAEYAVLKAAQGQKQAALEHLQKACEGGSTGWQRWVFADPTLAILHGDPAFEALVARAGVSEHVPRGGPR